MSKQQVSSHDATRNGFIIRAIGITQLTGKELKVRTMEITCGRSDIPTAQRKRSTTLTETRETVIAHQLIHHSLMSQGLPSNHRPRAFPTACLGMEISAGKRALMCAFHFTPSLIVHVMIR